MKIGLIGPTPPPNGGMAMLTLQLLEELSCAGHRVEHVVTNSPYRSKFIGKIPVLRAFVRLADYIVKLKVTVKHFDVVHLMANSGWSYYLFAMPVIFFAKRADVPVVMNYHGGLARSFFKANWRWIKGSMMAVDQILVPSAFLKNIFSEVGLASVIVPNMVDLTLFKFKPVLLDEKHIHIVVTRNLEPIYDIATAIESFAIFHQTYPLAKLSIAGSGSELVSLQKRVEHHGLVDSVSFVGTLTREQVANLYQGADILLNTSLADNTPGSIIEALACGLVIVSTNVGGIPDLITDEKHGYLQPPKSPQLLAVALQRAIENKDKSRQIAQCGHEMVCAFGPKQVVNVLDEIYKELM